MFSNLMALFDNNIIENVYCRTSDRVQLAHLLRVAISDNVIMIHKNLYKIVLSLYGRTNSNIIYRVSKNRVNFNYPLVGTLE